MILLLNILNLEEGSHIEQQIKQFISLKSLYANYTETLKK